MSYAKSYDFDAVTVRFCIVNRLYGDDARDMMITIPRMSKDLELFVVTTGRFFSIIMCAFIFNCLLIGTVFAGFFGSDDKGQSGLDFTSGYDINTVTTMSGRAISLPHVGEKNNVIVEIRSGNESLNICVGPGPYWEKQGIAINLNDELTVKGSRAQGKDGKSYLLTQKLVNRTTGAQMDLRSDKGEPAWSGPDMNNSMRSQSPAGGMRTQGGGMMRSGGGMMRSGGGMMRR